MAGVRLAEIRMFPVKSLRGGMHEAAEVEGIGLRGDRRWMVVDAHGAAMTQREVHRMALVQAVTGADGVVLTADGMPPLTVGVPGAGAPARNVVLWRQAIAAVGADEAADSWLSQALGVACTLVYLADPAARPVDPDYAAPGNAVSFADGFPVLLTARESLADLNARMAHPVEMLRFRPNLVIEGAAAWAEDRWRRVRIGGAVFRVVKPCERCVIPSIDPETAERPDPDEPLRTLKTFRRDARGRVLFGQNLVPEVCGVVRVGDRVERM